MRIIIPCIEGWVEWMKGGDENSIYSQVVKAFNLGVDFERGHTAERIQSVRLKSKDGIWGEPDVTTFTAKKFQSFGYWQVSAVRKWLMSFVGGLTDDRLILVGKSKGGVKAVQLLMENTWIFTHFAKVALVLVDAHGNIPCDGVVGPYKKIRDLQIPGWLWGKVPDGKLMIYNVFQHHAVPSGARIAHPLWPIEEFNLTGEDVDHFSIVRHVEVKKKLAAALAFAQSLEDGRKFLQPAG